MHSGSRSEPEPRISLHPQAQALKLHANPSQRSESCHTVDGKNEWGYPLLPLHNSIVLIASEFPKTGFV